MAETKEVATIKNPLASAENSEAELLKLSTKEAYFASLSEWARQSHDLQMFYNFLNFSHAIHQSNQLIQEEAQAIVRVNNPELRGSRSDIELVRLLDGEQRLQIIQGWGGTEMLVAPFWKRATAELIDTLIICILKIILAFLIHNSSSPDFEKHIARKSLSEEQIYISLFEVSLDLFTLSYDVLVFILLTKAIVCCYECLWIIFNNGSTPGKYWMNLRVLYVETMVPLEQQREVFQVQSTAFWALIYPAVTPNGLRTFLRVVTKNLIVTCIFPVCIILLFPRNNRTTYDIISKTVVVEMNTERPPTQPRPHVH
ncbi:hypothetical protein ACLKA6_019402 [Drosophila palustris]